MSALYISINLVHLTCLLHFIDKNICSIEATLINAYLTLVPNREQSIIDIFLRDRWCSSGRGMELRNLKIQNKGTTILNMQTSN